jgi:hypothetical protein
VGRSLWRADFYLGARAERKKKARGGREEAARSGLNPLPAYNVFYVLEKRSRPRVLHFDISSA